MNSISSFFVGYAAGSLLILGLTVYKTIIGNNTAVNKVIHLDETHCVIAEKSECDNVLLDAYIKKGE